MYLPGVRKLILEQIVTSAGLHVVGQYFSFTWTTILPKVFLKDLLSHLRTNPRWITFWRKKGLSIGNGGVTIYVILHDTESSNRISQVFSLDRGCQQQEVDPKIILGVSECLNNGYKFGVKMLDTDIITLLLAYVIRFHRLCDIMVDFGFDGNCFFFNIISGAPNISDSPFHGMIFSACSLSMMSYHPSSSCQN